VIGRLALFSATALFGALGAMMSLLTRKTASSSSSDERATPAQILSVEIVGAVFACVLSFFFAGGLIQGALFPTTQWGWFQVVYRSGDFL